ncbi:DEAD-box ATP-dependent RNA helicase CshA [Rhodococcus aetherivorans]|uniref:ATP-dependent RNA helicase DeaD n=1 Tax=Rhodococcus aetherivorans TaxID=191292 RepID=A0ABQ0YR15_9NOCA|nr:DEAD/DEAH box helicase [Rhodococcus aetherivorans]ETT26510.1 DEAD/DEAH box helicase domain protein [Rhodococcus rhodochrous ATCC 21198]KDE14336.1 cold-shock protein [Rhodococcus aetherivorans]NGP26026.1 DEAD/DEAH box helicase [Rhodococcus aetherivorans]GES39034.1 DEAD-box ATP-dependent RNA helicase CshA [Rhodococcus aetherivorans]
MSDTVQDPEADTATPTFADLDIDARVLQALSDVGYETPSPIQAATIPPLLEGRDVVGLAQTGTGKTAAFAVPILSRIDTAVKRPQALVLAPTRELALQVAEAFGKYSAHIPGLHVLPIYGGQSYGVQLSGLRRGAHVIVGTPGRVIDHLAKGTLDISELEFLVLDEADEMLTMGFQEDVERILADTPETKQVALFSATMPGAIRRLSKQYLHDPVEITVKSKTTTSANITQRWVLVSHQRKLDALTRILEVEQFEAMILFVRTKQATEDLAERLRARGFSAAAINGDIVQAQRERTIGQLKSGALDILVATDVAARGLDVDRISHVVNYDIPHDTESYVHRIGRTGRAGRSGDALLFVAPRERHLLKAIERATRQPLTEIQLPSVEDVNAQRVEKFNDSITEALTSDHLSLFRTFVEDYEREHDVPLADIAAALAVLSRDGESFLMEAEPEPVAPPRREREPRERPPRRFDDDGASRVGRDGQEMATYRIAVGKRHRVVPGAIVGAIANEGGLRRSDFGHISIRPDHSLVELPKDLSPETLEALRGTRISGVLIQLQPDSGAPAGRPSTYRQRDDRGERRQGERKEYGGKKDWGDRGGRNKDFGGRGDRFGDKPNRGFRERSGERGQSGGHGSGGHSSGYRGRD